MGCNKCGQACFYVVPPAEFAYYFCSRRRKGDKSPRNLEIYLLYVQSKVKQRDLALRFGVSHSRVGQILNKVFRNLRGYLKRLDIEPHPVDADKREKSP